jgi:hypothetical protein
VKQKVTSVCDILSFAYSGVESLRTPPLPRKSYRLQIRRVCCSSLCLDFGRLTSFSGSSRATHPTLLSSCDVVLQAFASQERVRERGSGEEWGDQAHSQAHQGLHTSFGSTQQSTCATILSYTTKDLQYLITSETLNTYITQLISVSNPAPPVFPSAQFAHRSSHATASTWYSHPPPFARTSLNCLAMPWSSFTSLEA